MIALASDKQFWAFLVLAGVSLAVYWRWMGKGLRRAAIGLAAVLSLFLCPLPLVFGLSPREATACFLNARWLVTDGIYSSEYSNGAFDKVELRMTKKEVLDLLGPPVVRGARPWQPEVWVYGMDEAGCRLYIDARIRFDSNGRVTWRSGRIQRD